MPRPPPMSSTDGLQPSSARARSQNAASRSTASRLSSTCASCEPTWKWTPATSSPSRRAGARGLVRSVEHHGDTERRGSAKLLVGLVVAVEQDLLARDSGGLCEFELAERRDIGSDALLAEHPQQGDVRERLRPVHDERSRSSVRVRARLCANGLLAVDDERRPVLLREPRGADSSQGERTGV